MNQNFQSGAKVAVVGAGNVGSSFAYALLLSGLAAEIVIIDVNQAKAEGEAMDLQHSAPFSHSTIVRAGTYEDCAGAVVTVVTAGANQKPGESRLELVKKNAGIFGQIIPAIAGANPEGLILIATNPVDAMTYHSIKLSGLSSQKVFGSGTILDTGRFRHFIGAHLGVDPKSVGAYIIGEHGDSEVPVWSHVTIGGVPLEDYSAATGKTLDAADKTLIYEQTRDAAQHIIQRKGATHYAIGAGLVEIVQAIIRDTNTVLPVGYLADNWNGITDVVFGHPAVVNRQGISQGLPLKIDESERAALERSVEVLRASISHL